MVKKLFPKSKPLRFLIPATLIAAGLMVIPYLLTKFDLRNVNGGFGKSVNVPAGTRLYLWTPKPDGCYVTDADPITLSKPTSGKVMSVLSCQYAPSDGYPPDGNEYSFTFIHPKGETDAILVGAKDFNPPLPLTD